MRGQRGGGWYFLPAASPPPGDATFPPRRGPSTGFLLRHIKSESFSRIVLGKRESEVTAIAGDCGLGNAWLRFALCTRAHPMLLPYVGGAMASAVGCMLVSPSPSFIVEPDSPG